MQANLWNLAGVGMGHSQYLTGDSHCLAPASVLLQQLAGTAKGAIRPRGRGTADRFRASRCSEHSDSGQRRTELSVPSAATADAVSVEHAFVTEPQPEPSRIGGKRRDRHQPRQPAEPRDLSKPVCCVPG